MSLQESGQIQQTIDRALSEDIGTGDVTSEWVLPPGLVLTGEMLVKADGVIAGLAVAATVFKAVDRRVVFEPLVDDGSPVTRRQVVAKVTGPARAILSAERVALNFVQRMSGIASMTRRYVEAVRGTKAIILDTRKTAPGLRILDKIAVQLGGGQNHRIGLYDMVLIKDNHIAAAGSITEAVKRVRAHNRFNLPVEVEVKNLNELGEALALGVDRILLDNMDLEQMTQAATITSGRAKLEASGGITLDNVAAVAMTGVDFVSVGALTHSVHALDISLDVEER